MLTYLKGADDSIYKVTTKYLLTLVYGSYTTSYKYHTPESANIHTVGTQRADDYVQSVQGSH